MSFKRLLYLTISSIFYIFILLPKVFRCLFKFDSTGSCVIIYYHSVKDEERAKFARQLDQLCQIATPIFASHYEYFEKNTHYVSVTFDDGFASIVKNALPEMDSRRIPATIFVPTGYLAQVSGWIKSGMRGYEKERVITAENLISFNDKLVEVGSHSVNHVDLTQIPDKDVIMELQESKLSLENILGKQIKLFSFPYGAYNESIIKMAKNLGYKRIFTSSPCIVRFSFKDCVFGRIGVNPADWPLEFRLKVSGAYSWLPIASKLKSKLISIVLKCQNMERTS